MSLSFSRSVRFGAVRFNFSGAGIGVSVGIPGLRVGIGARGAYVGGGIGGFRYRKSLNAQPQGSGGFIYSADGGPIPIRSRAHWESSERKLEWVPPEELDQALVQTVTLGFSMSREDAISGALGLLGFGRATSKIAGMLDTRIETLAAEGRLQVGGGVVTAATASA